MIKEEWKHYCADGHDPLATMANFCPVCRRAPSEAWMREAILNADPVLNELGNFIAFIADQVKGGEKIHVIDSRIKLAALVKAFSTLDQAKWNAALSLPAAPDLEYAECERCVTRFPVASTAQRECPVCLSPRKFTSKSAAPVAPSDEQYADYGCQDTSCALYHDPFGHHNPKSVPVAEKPHQCYNGRVLESFAGNNWIPCPKCSPSAERGGGRP